MNDKMNDLETAIAIAVESHKGHPDKAGRPYVLHPLRMMFRLSDEIDMTVAVLHDVVEDTDWTPEKLRDRGFSKTILTALDGVTNREGESYEEFIERAAGNPVSRRVKLADLEDNMDVRRLNTVTEKDAVRLSKYLRAWRRLKEQ
jgi:(p)ppGpp synthase/HD superfamily hydrolase